MRQPCCWDSCVLQCGMWPDLDIHSWDIYIWNGHCSLPWQSGKGSWHLSSKNDSMPKKMLGELCPNRIHFSPVPSSYLYQIDIGVFWNGVGQILPLPGYLACGRVRSTKGALAAVHPSLLFQLIINVLAVCMHGRRCRTAFVRWGLCWYSPAVNPGLGNLAINLQEVQFSH